MSRNNSLPCCCTQLCTNEFYTSDRFMDDARDYCANGYCLVWDPIEDLPEDSCRFCNFRRASSEETDIGFGHYGDTEGKSKKQIMKINTGIRFRAVVLLQAVMFGLLGFFLVFYPEAVSKHLLFESDYKVSSAVNVARRNYEAYGGDAKKLEIRNNKIEKESENNEITLLSTVLHSLENSLKKEPESNHDSFEERQEKLLKEAERTLQEATLQEAQRIAEEQPEELTVTSFSSMFGAMCLSTAVMSSMAYLHTSTKQQLSFARYSMITFFFIVLSLAASSFRRSAGNESTNLMTFAMIYCLVMMVAWFIIHSALSKIVNYDLASKLKARYDQEEKEKDQELDAHVMNVMSKAGESNDVEP